VTIFAPAPVTGTVSAPSALSAPFTLPASTPGSFPVTTAASCAFALFIATSIEIAEGKGRCIDSFLIHDDLLSSIFLYPQSKVVVAAVAVVEPVLKLNLKIKNIGEVQTESDGFGPKKEEVKEVGNGRNEDIF
jgi:hypothetical protein